MAWDRLRDRLARRLERADIVLDGTRPWDPVVHEPRLYWRMMAEGTLGLGDASVDGWWDCEALDELAARRQLRGAAGHHVLDKRQHGPGAGHGGVDVEQRDLIAQTHHHRDTRHLSAIRRSQLL